jgi:ribulose-5-phosphate 4-epimerase/fuculose-1-phosphate aldolase
LKIYHSAAFKENYIDMQNYDDIRLEVLDSCRWLAEHGYLGRLSSGGNISVRVPGEESIAITPSGRTYFSLDLNDICVIDFDQNLIAGSLAPSIEAGMHIGVYRHRPDVKAVIHTHQPFAGTLSIINKPIPALFDEIVVEIGHVVDIVPYAFSGSPQLVDNVTAKLGNACHCYLIQNHGALSLGADMPRAMRNSELLENVARIYYQALATGTDIQTLPETAIEHFAAMRKLRFK